MKSMKTVTIKGIPYEITDAAARSAVAELQQRDFAKSAYEIAVEGGYESSEQDFYSDLAQKNEPFDYDTNVKSINHRGYSIEAPENTLPAYILSKEKGFKYVEADVAFTSDNIPVLLHDSTIDRTSNGTGSINDFTFQQVRQLDFGSWFSEKYIGTKIPSFKEFILLCKHLGLHPYIELKQSDNYTQEQIAIIVNLVKQCGMQGKVSYISFNSTFLEYVKNIDSSARLGFLSVPTNTAIDTIAALKTAENEVFLDASYLSVHENSILYAKSKNIPIEIWTVNDISIIESMHEYVSGVTSDYIIAGKVLYNKIFHTVEVPTDVYIELDFEKYEEGSSSIAAKGPGADLIGGAIVKGNPTKNYKTITLNNKDYFTMTFLESFNKDRPWTIVCQHGPVELSSQQYQRVFRTDNDVPSWYYSTANNSWGCKTAKSGKIASSEDILRNSLSLNGNTFITVCDGKHIYSYANGILYSVEAASNLTNPSYIIGCGDTSGNADWYFNSIEIKQFKIFNRALSAAEVEAISL